MGPHESRIPARRHETHRPSAWAPDGVVKDNGQDRIRVVDNPIRARDPKLGRAFEGVVWDVLRHEHLQRISVRFGVWRDESEVTRFVCKVECPEAVGAEGERVSWRWWSPLLRSPRELRGALRKALQTHRQRLALATAAAEGSIA